ncbi:lectin-domain containing receptor kinase VI.3-like [Tripterygium wilfordii]|uniref:Lectin-domain containing receptor kinase VI.3-like n=2 Tax=Tripterygium wilfordii TaxID=458696 RepID=A0A7J7DWX1_TRIWF|nr:lectin-domain containing receptor kinase VI.3-like [Tripterygium wilfordii]
MECRQLGQILDVVDPQLESHYPVEEMELVLRLGLLCSHSRAEDRPTMRQITQILNGDDNLLEAINSGSMDSRSMTSRYIEAVPSEMTGATHRSSSFAISTTSIDAGR